MKEIKVQDAVGHALVHDIVRIVIGEVKDTPFRRGHVITEADVPKLLDLGKEHIYVMEPEDEGFLHEEDVGAPCMLLLRETICMMVPWHKVKLRPLPMWMAYSRSM